MVEELFPAFISVMAEVDMGHRIVPGFYGLFGQLHPGGFWCLAALFDVTRRACTDDIFPGCFATQAARDDVVER